MTFGFPIPNIDFDFNTECKISKLTIVIKIGLWTAYVYRKLKKSKIIGEKDIEIRLIYSKVRKTNCNYEMSHRSKYLTQ